MKEITRQTSVDVGKNWKQDILPGYEDNIAELLNIKKFNKLQEFFTNPVGRVTVIVPGPRDITAAVLTARSSRANERDVTELFWKEFREQSGEDVADRILNEFGDDSVREDASAYVSVRDISVLTSMFAFRHPLITGIEASTRYIDWGSLPISDFAVVPEALAENPRAMKLYSEAIKTSYDTYKYLWPLVSEYLVNTNPKTEDQPEAAYKKAVKGAVCDALRGLLPLGVKTNLILHANYRSLTEMAMNMRASKFDETRAVADEISYELIQVNRPFAKVINSEHGRSWTEYQKRSAELLLEFGQNYGQWIQPKNFDLNVKVKALNADWQADLIRAAQVSKRVGLSDYDEIELAREFLAGSSLSGLLEGINAIRTNRRDKLPDFMDAAQLRVGVENMSLGSLKDLNRQRRVLAKSDPDLSGRRGSVVPDLIEKIGGDVKAKYVNAQEKISDLRQKLESDFPEESHLLLTHGTKTAVEMVMGIGEAFWISELRSLASNAPENRKIAIGLYRGMVKEIPMLSVLGKFVDMNDYTLGRIGEAVRADLKGK